jgi:chromosome segregation ATPase
MLDPAENEKWNSLDRRVERLEEDMTDVKASLRSIEGKVDSLVEGVAEIRGRVSQSPTWLQLLLALIATWGAGAAIVATAIRFTPK